MDIVTAGSALLGGLGLFLVGMWLMTDGLKLAAGESLRGILERWTYTRFRSLATGFFITALVQSSSAVTVATIGFANAGLLSLQQAVWVIFGSNVGTTVTGWLVAIIGFKVNIDAYALPLIGIGMLIRLTGQKNRRAAVGQAIVGFGLFFLGISVLKEAFESVGAGIHLPGVQEAGFASIFLYVVLGVLLTTLMQSSSAAIVVTLSAAESGMIPLGAAAATVIGTNLGTTSTAILSVWGATATAKRVAVSHVLFNLITAGFAILIIVPMLALTGWIQTSLNLTTSTATTLAIFHTIFNVLGVLLMWPITSRLITFLSARFVSEEEVQSKPRYLDKNALAVPALASVALLKEINSLNQRTISSAMDAISSEEANSKRFLTDKNNVEKLALAIGNYVAELSRTDLPENITSLLPDAILVVQQYVVLTDLACEIIAQPQNSNISQSQDKILAGVIKLKHDVILVLENAVVNAPDFDLEAMNRHFNELDSDYEALRLSILMAGAKGVLSMVGVDAQLSQASTLKSIARQTVKATNRHVRLTPEMSSGPLASGSIRSSGGDMQTIPE